MFSRSFTQGELELKQLKQKHLPRKIHSLTLKHDNQNKFVHYMVKLGTVFCSRENDCHLLLADFGIDQISFRNIDKLENIKIKQLDSFSFVAVKSFPSQF